MLKCGNSEKKAFHTIPLPLQVFEKSLTTLPTSNLRLFFYAYLTKLLGLDRYFLTA